MKKTLLNLLFLFVGIAIAFGQTSLPTSYSFLDPYPNGWSQNNTDLYTTIFSNTIPSCKLHNYDLATAGNSLVQIYFSEPAGQLSYWLKGASFSGGQFDIQESVNGTDWTNVRTITSPNTSWEKIIDTVDYSSRYVRFYYTNKVSGNIALDDIELLPGPPTPDAEINIKQENYNIISGSTFTIGNDSTTAFTIENIGTDSVMYITNYTITGIDSADFSIDSMPSAINALDSSYFYLYFTPTGSGSEFATINIENNDSNENPYIINIYAIADSFATEPTAQPTNLTFLNVKSYTFNVSFDDATPSPEYYIVLKQKETDITDLPVDGTTYVKGDYIGSAQVIYIGSANTLKPNNIIANTSYYFKIFSFDGPEGFENYLTDNPLSSSVTTSDAMIGSYYDGISTSSPTFLQDLHNKIYPHTQIWYSLYDDDMINVFESRDTTGGQKIVTCVYTGDNYLYTQPFSWWSTGEMSREHTLCQSWMPTNSETGFEDSEEYSDLYNLFPTLYTNANAKRSNHPLGIVENVTYQYLDGKLGTDIDGNTVYEPRDEHKGDAARAMFYMCICYNSVNDNVWNLPSNQDQSILKTWNFQDTPDNWEIARNDYIYSLQNNRNPFIDSINFVNYIDFYSLGIKENNLQNNNINVYPNPSKDLINIKISDKIENIKIYNFIGQIVFDEIINDNSVQINTSNYKPGIYFITIKTKNKLINKKIIITEN